MATLLAEEYRATVEPPVRESDGAGEALPVYLQEIGRVPLLTGPARWSSPPRSRPAWLPLSC